MRRLNSLKHLQHFDAHNSNQKEEKEKKKEENIKCTTFRNKCNIAKPFELAEGKYSSQPPRGVPRKRCSENMPQFKRRTHICRKTISIKLFCKITLRHGCSSENLLHISGQYFLKDTSGGLLLRIVKVQLIWVTFKRTPLYDFCNVHLKLYFQDFLTRLNEGR